MKAFLLYTFAILCLATTQGHAAEIIGQVSELKGTLTKTVDERQITIRQGDALHLHDALMTGPDSAAKLTFKDNTAITLGAESAIVIDEYVYDPADPSGNKAQFNLEKSVFHYVSGLLSKTENPDVQLDLAFGSIGVRGTEIWRDMVMDPQEGETCRIYLENGEASVSNAKGAITLKHGEGTKIHGLENAPIPPEQWSDEAIATLKAKTQL